MHLLHKFEAPFSTLWLLFFKYGFKTVLFLCFSGGLKEYLMLIDRER